jgi:tRNA (adenine22-N1)-methyltransferase
MMNNRPEAIASLVSSGTGLIDVGTDHGYLPVRLAQRAYTGFLYASDINPGPLAAARRTAREASVEDRIGFLLCDGLDDCPKDRIDTIVIAGMGGDLICRILDRAEWCLDGAYTLILQPMTKAEVLRYWLVNNGYCLEEERLVRDGGKLYQIIRARFSQNMPLSDAELYAGAFENIRGEALCREWLDTLIRRFEKEAHGLLHAGQPEEGRLAICQGILSGLIGMKGKLP